MAMEIEKMTFEQALSELEKIVNDLENENIELESSVEKFELGVKLSSYCLSKLNEAEKKIEELTKDENGELVIKELETD